MGEVVGGWSAGGGAGSGWVAGGCALRARRRRPTRLCSSSPAEAKATHADDHQPRRRRGRPSRPGEGGAGPGGALLRCCCAAQQAGRAGGRASVCRDLACSMYGMKQMAAMTPRVALSTLAVCGGGARVEGASSASVRHLPNGEESTDNGGVF